MSDDVKQDETTTPAAATPPPEPELTQLADVLADPTPEELEAAAAPVVEPGEGEPAAAVQEPAPNADAGGVAAGEELEAEEEPIAPPTKGEDGKWRSGKYQADSLEQLFVEVEKGRRNAEKLVGKKKEELAEDPFLLPQDEVDEFELVDDVDFGQQIGAGVAQALAQAGIGGQPQQNVDPYAAHAQSQQIANMALQSPTTTDDEFRQVLAALISTNPDDAQSRQVVLEEWGMRSPVQAAQEATRIEMAFAQHHQQLQYAQQQQQAQQLFEQEQQLTTEQQQGQAEYQFAQQTFVQQHPDWEARNDRMNNWLQANAWVMEQAKQVPLVNPENPQDRPRARAVNGVLRMAYEAAGAGIGAGVSEQGTNMGSGMDPNVNTAATAHSAIAHQRGLAGLETGAAVDDVTIQVANKDPQGLADTSFKDLVGFDTVS
jgi:hypothetical protein